jgi:hypothetical protein
MAVPLDWATAGAASRPLPDRIRTCGSVSLGHPVPCRAVCQNGPGFSQTNQKTLMTEREKAAAGPDAGHPLRACPVVLFGGSSRCSKPCLAHPPILPSGDGYKAMGIAFRVGDHLEEIGTEDFLYAFFSTIGSLLEPRGWGTRYPEIMNSLYRGELHRSKARKAIEEVRDIRVSLAQFSPDQVVWDIDNRDKQPPRGNTPHIGAASYLRG